MEKPTIELLIDLQEVDLRLPEFKNKKQKFNTYTVTAQTTDTQTTELQKFGIKTDEMITSALYNDVNLYIFKKITRQILYHCGKPRVYKTGLFSGPEKYLEFNNYMMNSSEYLSNYDWILISHHSLSKLIDENEEFNFEPISLKPDSDETINGVLEEKGYLEINEKQLKVFVTAYYPSNHNETEKIDMILGKGNWAEGEYFTEEHPKTKELNNTKYSMSVYSKEMFPSKRGYMRIVIEK